MDRRQLLQLGGVGAGAALLENCARRERVLIEQTLQRSRVPPGAERWRRSVCGQCPGACEIQVRVIDGAAKKIEGDATSPVSGGGVCALGHTALQALYAPQRPVVPAHREADGALVETSWEDALAVLGRALAESAGAVALCCGPDPVERAMVGAIARELGASVTVVEARHAAVERVARRRVWGRDVELALDFGRADLLITFGASILDRWGNPVAQARAVADARARGVPLVHVGERMSLTAAKADLWLPSRPGAGSAVIAVLEDVLRGGGADDGAAWDATGIPRGRRLELHRLVRSSRRPLLVVGAEGVGEVEPVTRAFALQRELGGVRAFDLDGPLSTALSPVSAAVAGEDSGVATVVASAPRRSLRELVEAVAADEVSVVLALDVDPVAAVPSSWGLEDALRNATLVAATSAAHRTAALAHWVLPVQVDLERVQLALSVDAVEVTVEDTVEDTVEEPVEDAAEDTADGSGPLLQLADPVVEARGEARHPVDVLRSLAVAAGAVPKDGSWADAEEARERLVEGIAEIGDARPASALRSALRGEGRLATKLEPVPPADPPPADPGVSEETGIRGETGTGAGSGPAAGGDLELVLFEGARGERTGWGRPWLCELPDPVTTVMWGSWIELAPGDARRLGLDSGDPVTVSARDGSGASRSVASTAFVHPACRPGVAFMPVGDFPSADGASGGDPRDLLGAEDVAGAPLPTVVVGVVAADTHAPAPVLGRGLRRPEHIPAGWKGQQHASAGSRPVADTRGTARRGTAHRGTAHPSTADGEERS